MTMVHCGYRLIVMSNLAYFLTLAHTTTVGKTHKVFKLFCTIYTELPMGSSAAKCRHLWLMNLYAPPLIERTLIRFLMGRKAKTKQIILFFNRFRLAHDQIASWLPFGLNKSSMGFAPLYKLSCRFNNNNAGSYCSMVMMMDTLIKSSCHDLL